MNYITSCPECSTQFLLSEEHLKAHRGKVQCGHCQHVFNAKNRLTEVAEEEVSSSVLENLAEKTEDGDIEEIVASKQGVEVVVESDTAEINEVFEKSAAEPGETSLPETGVETAAPIQIEDLSAAPGFKPLPAKPRWALRLATLVLLLGAASQAIYYLRTPIAAQLPQFKPLLANICASLGCSIDLPRNLDLLLIDDSDMQQDEVHESVINFSSSLINHANYAQAFPDIELTLTNVNDEPVIRTLLKPAQYLKTGIKQEEGIGAQQELDIKLALSAGTEAVSGYRVQLVY